MEELETKACAVVATIVIVGLVICVGGSAISQSYPSPRNITTKEPEAYNFDNDHRSIISDAEKNLITSTELVGLNTSNISSSLEI